jgi:hypothetical protein
MIVYLLAEDQDVGRQGDRRGAGEVERVSCARSDRDLQTPVNIPAAPARIVRTTTGAWYFTDTPEDRLEALKTKVAYERTPAAEIQRRISQVRGHSTELTMDEVYGRVCTLLTNHLVMPKRLRMQGLWRAQKGNVGEFFENAKRLWYPPEELVTNLGRLNAKGESVFYCAPTREIAAFETRPQVGDWITLLAADKRERLRPLQIIPLGLEQCTSPVLKAIGYKPVRHDPPIRDSLGSENNYRKWCKVDDFLGELLTQAVSPGEEDRYKATIALAKAMHRFPGVDGFAYPSIATERQGVNLCLTTAAADSHLQPLSCHVFRIDAPMAPPWVFATSYIASSSSIAPDWTITWQHHDEGPADAAKLSVGGADWGRPAWFF